MPGPIRTLVIFIVYCLSSVPALVPLLVLPFVAWLCYRAWARGGDQGAARWIAGLALALGLSDGLLLIALPRLGLSFGPVGPPWLGMILIRTGLVLGPVVIWRRPRSAVENSAQRLKVAPGRLSTGPPPFELGLRTKLAWMRLVRVGGRPAAEPLSSRPEPETSLRRERSDFSEPLDRLGRGLSRAAERSVKPARPEGLSKGSPGAILPQGRLWRNRQPNFQIASQGTSRIGMVVFLWVLNLLILGCEIYGLHFEPFNLKVTQVSVTLPAEGRPIRVVQLSDLHIERITKRERAVLETVERLEPDLILLTGDYLNLSYLDDPLAQRDARAFLAQLHAPYGVYAIVGTLDFPKLMTALFDGLNITVLDDEVQLLHFEGNDLYLLGVSNRGWERDADSLRAMASYLPPDAFTILMYHTPDLIEVASELGVDVYLAGHTHGGQIRLPWFGAIVTASRYKKRYEAGLYWVGSTQLYVSRGIGMEGWVAPRVRFLCAPEVVELSLVGQ